MKHRLQRGDNERPAMAPPTRVRVVTDAASATGGDALSGWFELPGGSSSPGPSILPADWSPSAALPPGSGWTGRDGAPGAPWPAYGQLLEAAGWFSLPGGSAPAGPSVLPRGIGGLGVRAFDGGAESTPGSNYAEQIVVTPEVPFGFDGRVGSTQEIVLAPRVDARAWDGKRAVLSVRLHSKSWRSTTCRALVEVWDTAFPWDGQDLLFVGPKPLASVSIANADVAPKLYTAAFLRPSGPLVRVVVRWEQGSVGSTSAERFSIGVDLLGRG